MFLLLDKNHILLAQLYGSNKTAVARHQAAAATLREGILDLFWNSTKVKSSPYRALPV